MLPADQLMSVTLATARRIASKSHIAVKLAKEAVNESYEMSLSSGINLEKKLFYSTFSTVSND